MIWVVEQGDIVTTPSGQCQLKLSPFSVSSVISSFLCLDHFYVFSPEQYKPRKMQHYIYNGHSMPYLVILLPWNCGRTNNLLTNDRCFMIWSQCQVSGWEKVAQADNMLWDALYQSTLDALKYLNLNVTPAFFCRKRHSETHSKLKTWL